MVFAVASVASFKDLECSKVSAKSRRISSQLSMYLTMTFQSLGLCEGDGKNSRRPSQQEQQSGRIVSNRIWYQAPMRQERTGAIDSTPRAWSRQNPEGVWQTSIQTEISADSNVTATTAISSNRIWYHVPLHQDRTGSDNRIPRTWSRQNPDGVWQTPRQLRVSSNCYWKQPLVLGVWILRHLTLKAHQ